MRNSRDDFFNRDYKEIEEDIEQLKSIFLRALKEKIVTGHPWDEVMDMEYDKEFFRCGGWIEFKDQTSYSPNKIREIVKETEGWKVRDFEIFTIETHTERKIRVTGENFGSVLQQL